MQGQAPALRGFTISRPIRIEPQYITTTEMGGFIGGAESIGRWCGSRAVLSWVIVFGNDEANLAFPFRGFDRHLLLQ